MTKADIPTFGPPSDLDEYKSFMEGVFTSFTEAELADHYRLALVAANALAAYLGQESNLRFGGVADLAAEVTAVALYIRLGKLDVASLKKAELGYMSSNASRFLDETYKDFDDLIAALEDATRIYKAELAIDIEEDAFFNDASRVIEKLKRDRDAIKHSFSLAMGGAKTKKTTKLIFFKALSLFEKYSPKPAPSTYHVIDGRANGPFLEFLRPFYKIATGRNLDGTPYRREIKALGNRNHGDGE